MLTVFIEPWIAFPAAALLGYLLGSIPFGLVLVRSAGLGDIRNVGSGNIGATNVLRTGRKDLALLTLALDAGKAAAALLAAQFGLLAIGADPSTAARAGLIGGAAAFLGHCFPLWLGFRGGKGVATFFGVLLAGLPYVGLAAAAVWLASAGLTRLSSLSSLTAAALAPIFAFFLTDDTWAIAFCFFLAALIFYTHRENIGRLLSGSEPRIGARKASQTPPAADA